MGTHGNPHPSLGFAKERHHDEQLGEEAGSLWLGSTDRETIDFLSGETNLELNITIFDR